MVLFVTMFFSMLSVGMMSYLAMNTLLGPWIAPLFVVVCMVLAIPFVSKRWFDDHAILSIAAGSIGGMVGTALGVTVPAFYFLHKEQFLALFDHPIFFALLISGFVFCAGTLAFSIAYYVKDHFIVEEKLPFPTSQLVYDVLSVEHYPQNSWLMLIGIGWASVWNIVTLFARAGLQAYTAQVHMIPIILSIGFVAGHLIAVPICIGLLTRLSAVSFLQERYFSVIPQQEFLVTFCVGIILVLVSHGLWDALQKENVAKMKSSRKLRLGLHNRNFLLQLGCALFVNVCLLSFCGVNLIAQCCAIPLIIIIGLNLARIVGETGMVTPDSFAWFVILPLVYSQIGVTSLSILMLATVATICFGMIVDLLFSYKLAQLADIPYHLILKYQQIGFIVAALCSGLIMWWYIHLFGLGSVELIAGKAQGLDKFITSGVYNYHIILCGFVWGLVIRMLCKELLVVIGAILMAPSITFWLLIAGALSYVVHKREKWFPLCFGVYAAHSLWILIRAVFHFA